MNIASPSDAPSATVCGDPPLAAGATRSLSQVGAADSDGGQHVDECDQLADELAQTFEELHCLRQMAIQVAVCDATEDVSSVAGRFLPALREIVGAETLALAPESARGPAVVPRSGMHDDRPTIVRAGNEHSAEEVFSIVRQINYLSPGEAVVYNRSSNLRRTEWETSVGGLVAVPLAHQQFHYGWLIALDRLPEASTVEFGSREVGLLETAATMLAGHARNVELFRAEERLRLGVIESITGALDARDPYTCGHSRRVATLAVQIAQQLGFTAEACERLYVTGLLHDVGKIGVPDDILRKPGRLTDEEFDVIKQHPTIGHDILAPLETLSYVLPGVLHHHERMDGQGYPHGLSGEAIPLDAKILAVADSYDAMTSDRAYRSGMPRQRAREILRNGAGDQWDRGITHRFLRLPLVPDDIQ